jgi:hypothetical protein
MFRLDDGNLLKLRSRKPSAALGEMPRQVGRCCAMGTAKFSLESELGTRHGRAA